MHLVFYLILPSHAFILLLSLALVCCFHTGDAAQVQCNAEQSSEAQQYKVLSVHSVTIRITLLMGLDCSTLNELMH